MFSLTTILIVIACAVVVISGAVITIAIGNNSR